LNNVSAIIKHTFNVFCVNGACEMWIAVVFTVSASGRYTLMEHRIKSFK